ncbi:hypothetical protein [Roseospira goensis]|uniref:Uncharacterized protein n=1 Tax=Roseospira goensis TaxID=391922 RepID=A0A7W6S262_9PROT|nr:hypothetical protein [Roseospira goensis]MBB4287498.1 hypothetical protein [Roseospira goensis]
MADTAPVEVTVVQVGRVNRGSLIALAVAEVTIAEVPIRLQAIPVRRAPGGGLIVQEPHTRGPGGAWYQACILPPEVHSALGSLIRAELTKCALVFTRLVGNSLRCPDRPALNCKKTRCLVREPEYGKKTKPRTKQSKQNTRRQRLKLNRVPARRNAESEIPSCTFYKQKVTQIY